MRYRRSYRKITVRWDKMFLQTPPLSSQLIAISKISKYRRLSKNTHRSHSTTVCQSPCQAIISQTHLQQTSAKTIATTWWKHLWLRNLEPQPRYITGMKTCLSTIKAIMKAVAEVAIKQVIVRQRQALVVHSIIERMLERHFQLFRSGVRRAMGKVNYLWCWIWAQVVIAPKLLQRILIITSKVTKELL